MWRGFKISNSCLDLRIKRMKWKAQKLYHTHTPRSKDIPPSQIVKYLNQNLPKGLPTKLENRNWVLVVGERTMKAGKHGPEAPDVTALSTAKSWWSPVGHQTLEIEISRYSRSFIYLLHRPRVEIANDDVDSDMDSETMLFMRRRRPATIWKAGINANNEERKWEDRQLNLNLI